MGRRTRVSDESGGWLRRYGWSLGVVAAAVISFLAAYAAMSQLLDGESGAPGGGAQALVSASPQNASPGAASSESGGSAPGSAAAVRAGAPAAGAAVRVSELPAFDDEALIYGGEGEQGAILAGPGIVRSSGFDLRTDWELIVPSAQLRAALVRVSVTPGNFLGAPDNPEVIGWWEEGPAPGEAGNVLLDGHRDFRDVNGRVGRGVSWLLPDTQPGDALIVRDRSDGSAFVYTVREVHSVAWNAPDGSAFLRATETPVLTLITCEGSFDEEAHNYSNRRVVVADLTDRVLPSAE